MKPYAASGESARRRLIGRVEQPLTAAQKQVRANWRAVKLVIDTLCVLTIILTPAIGVATESAEAALWTAGSLFTAIVLLEVIERGCKRQWRRLHQGR